VEHEIAENRANEFGRNAERNQITARSVADPNTLIPNNLII
jgi:hypothetical protein